MLVCKTVAVGLVEKKMKPKCDMKVKKAMSEVVLGLFFLSILSDGNGKGRQLVAFNAKNKKMRQASFFQNQVCRIQ